MKQHRHLYRTMLMVMAVSSFSNQSFAAAVNPILDPGSTLPTGVTRNLQGNTTTITQDANTPVATINWQDFSLQNNHTITFDQATNQHITINRVTSSLPSVIGGDINANGTIFILNKNGITFSSTSAVNVGSLLATTADDITSTALANGGTRYAFTATNQRSITNEGDITVSEGGYAILAAPHIDTGSGNVTADRGNIVLGSVTDYRVDVNGNGLITYTPNSNPTGTSAFGGTHSISGSGTLSAKSGNITVDQISSDITSSMNLSGIYDVSSFASGEDAGNVTIEGNQIVDLSSLDIDASGNNADAGDVSINGHQKLVIRDNSTIDASATGALSHGGTITIQAGLSTSELNGSPLILANNKGDLVYGGNVNVSAANATNSGLLRIIAHSLDIKGGSNSNFDVDCAVSSVCNTLFEDDFEQTLNPNRLNLEIITTQNLTFASSTFSDDQFDIFGDITLRSLQGGIATTPDIELLADTDGQGTASIIVNARNAIDLFDITTTDGNISLSSTTGNITTNDLTASEGNITLSAASGNVVVNDVNSVQGTISITSGGDISTQDLTNTSGNGSATNGGITLSATDAISTGNIEIFDNLTIESTDGGAITLGDIAVTSGSNYNTSILIQNTGGINAGNISLGNLANGVSSANFKDLFDATFDSAGDLTFNGVIDVNGTTDVSGTDQRLQFVTNALGDTFFNDDISLAIANENPTAQASNVRVSFDVNDTNQDQSGDVTYHGDVNLTVDHNNATANLDNPSTTILSSFSSRSGGASTFNGDVQVNAYTSNDTTNSNVNADLSIFAGLDLNNAAADIVLQNASVIVADNSGANLNDSNVGAYESSIVIDNANGGIDLQGDLNVRGNDATDSLTGPTSETSITLVVPIPPSPAPAPSPTPSSPPTDNNGGNTGDGNNNTDNNSGNNSNNNSTNQNNTNTDIANILNNNTDQDTVNPQIEVAANLAGLAPAAGGDENLPNGEQICQKMRCPQ